MTARSTLRRLGRSTAAGGTAAGLAWGSYLTAIGFAAQRSLATPASTPTAPSTRFRFLVPAHDEAVHIERTVASLLGVDYPDEQVEVHVVADNCTDATAELATAAGANVHVRTAPDHPGKGAALAWLIDRLPDWGADAAFVVVDADTVVDPMLLRAFDAGFQTDDVAALQGYYQVSDADTGGDVGFRSAALAVRHLVRPAGRTALGGSSSLYGNGMAFREPIARTHRWSNGLTEDLEMGMQLLLDGHTVGFCADAVVEAEMPTNLDDAQSQNERWEGGRLTVAQRCVPDLFRAARTRAHGRRWAYVDAAIDITLPPLTLVGAGTIAAGGAFVLLSPTGRRVRAAALAATATGLQVGHLAHALLLAGSSAEVRRSLLRAPAHLMWKSKVVATIVRRRPGSWVRTNRLEGQAAA